MSIDSVNDGAEMALKEHSLRYTEDGRVACAGCEWSDSSDAWEVHAVAVIRPIIESGAVSRYRARARAGKVVSPSIIEELESTEEGREQLRRARIALAAETVAYREVEDEVRERMAAENRASQDDAYVCGRNDERERIAADLIRAGYGQAAARISRGQA